MLAPSGVLYATFFALEPGRSWLKPHPRNKWGRSLKPIPIKIPTTTPFPLLQDLARQAGFRLDVDRRFRPSHPDHGAIPPAKAAALVWTS